MVVVRKVHALPARQLSQTVEVFCKPGHRSLVAAVLGRGHRDYGVGAVKGVHVGEDRLRVSLPESQGDVGTGDAEAEVMEDVAEIVRGETTVARKLYRGVADLRDPTQRARHIARRLLAHGVELE